MASPNRSVYPWVLGVLVTAAVVAGLVIWAVPSSPPGVEVALPPPTPIPELKVFISGAVARPGVYQLKEGDRLVDALVASGGPTADADLMAVNQALRVRDEDHLHIPRIGEVPAPVPAGATRSATVKVNINDADLDALKELPNIGETRAKAIMAYRQQAGSFSDLRRSWRSTGSALASSSRCETSSPCDRRATGRRLTSWADWYIASQCNRRSPRLSRT